MHCLVLVFSAAVLFSSSCCQSAEDYESFKQHVVLRIVPSKHKHVTLLSELEEQHTELDFWTLPYNLNHDVDVRVPPHLQRYMKNYLTRNGISYSVFIEDVQSLLDKELESMEKRRTKRDINSPSSLEDINEYILNSFSSHAEINDWLEQISEFCGSRCSTHDIGYTHEGRIIRLIKISGERRRNGNNKAIWIDGGIHGREWISPVTANNIIYNLITEYNTSRCVKHLVENFDWYILPVANPDGYDYSRIRNRMWRKNRKVTESPRRPWWVTYYYGSDYKNCYGVDLNRNFGFMWGETGTSSNPCSDIYGGPGAFSEPESIAIQNFTTMIHNKSELAVYLSLHAYGQFWLYSWGYTRQLPSNHNYLNRVARDSAKAIYWATNRKTQYIVGSAARTLYASSGASDDWTKGELGVKYAFTLELPPSDANAQGNGFLLPTTAIPEVAAATWPGIKTMAARVLQLDSRGNHARHDFCRY